MGKRSKCWAEEFGFNKKVHSEFNGILEQDNPIMLNLSLRENWLLMFPPTSGIARWD